MVSGARKGIGRSLGNFKRWINELLGDVGIVFYLSIFLIVVFLTVAALSPDETQRLAQEALDAPI